MYASCSCASPLALACSRLLHFTHEFLKSLFKFKGLWCWSLFRSFYYSNQVAFIVIVVVELPKYILVLCKLFYYYCYHCTYVSCGIKKERVLVFYFYFKNVYMSCFNMIHDINEWVWQQKCMHITLSLSLSSCYSDCVLLPCSFISYYSK